VAGAVHADAVSVADSLSTSRLDGGPTDKRPPFKFSALTRVWFSDTDAQGVVYYGRYLPYFDHARTEYHRHLGSLKLDGFEFVMRASNVEYHAPARFDDPLECFVRVGRIGRTSATFEYAAYKLPSEELMVTATQTLVLIDAGTRRPQPIPDEVRAVVKAFEGADLVQASA
jgi:acyl-CoA thioester hydrolase